MSQMGMRELGTNVMITRSRVNVQGNETAENWPPACPECNLPLHARWLPRDHSHEFRLKCFPCGSMWWRDELPLEPLAADKQRALSSGDACGKWRTGGDVQVSPALQCVTAGLRRWKPTREQVPA